MDNLIEFAQSFLLLRTCEGVTMANSTVVIPLIPFSTLEQHLRDHYPPTLFLVDDYTMPAVRKRVECLPHIIMSESDQLQLNPYYILQHLLPGSRGILDRPELPHLNALILMKIYAAKRAGMLISDIARAAGLSSSKVHTLLNMYFSQMMKVLVLTKDRRAIHVKWVPQDEMKPISPLDDYVNMLLHTIQNITEQNVMLVKDIRETLRTLLQDDDTIAENAEAFENLLSQIIQHVRKDKRFRFRTKRDANDNYLYFVEIVPGTNQGPRSTQEENGEGHLEGGEHTTLRLGVPVRDQICTLLQRYSEYSITVTSLSKLFALEGYCHGSESLLADVRHGFYSSHVQVTVYLKGRQRYSALWWCSSSEKLLPTTCIHLLSLDHYEVLSTMPIVTKVSTTSLTRSRTGQDGIPVYYVSRAESILQILSQPPHYLHEQELRVTLQEKESTSGKICKKSLKRILQALTRIGKIKIHRDVVVSLSGVDEEMINFTQALLSAKKKCAPSHSEISIQRLFPYSPDDLSASKGGLDNTAIRSNLFHRIRNGYLSTLAERWHLLHAYLLHLCSTTNTCEFKPIDIAAAMPMGIYCKLVGCRFEVPREYLGVTLRDYFAETAQRLTLQERCLHQLKPMWKRLEQANVIRINSFQLQIHTIAVLPSVVLDGYTFHFDVHHASIHKIVLLFWKTVARSGDTALRENQKWWPPAKSFLSIHQKATLTQYRSQHRNSPPDCKTCYELAVELKAKFPTVVKFFYASSHWSKMRFCLTKDTSSPYSALTHHHHHDGSTKSKRVKQHAQRIIHHTQVKRERQETTIAAAVVDAIPAPKVKGSMDVKTEYLSGVAQWCSYLSMSSEETQEVVGTMETCVEDPNCFFAPSSQRLGASLESVLSNPSQLIVFGGGTSENLKKKRHVMSLVEEDASRTLHAISLTPQSIYDDATARQLIASHTAGNMYKAKRHLQQRESYLAWNRADILPALDGPSQRRFRAKHYPAVFAYLPSGLDETLNLRSEEGVAALTHMVCHRDIQCFVEDNPSTKSEPALDPPFAIFKDRPVPKVMDDYLTETITSPTPPNALSATPIAMQEDIDLQNVRSQLLAAEERGCIVSEIQHSQNNPRSALITLAARGECKCVDPFEERYVATIFCTFGSCVNSVYRCVVSQEEPDSVWNTDVITTCRRWLLDLVLHVPGCTEEVIWTHAQRQGGCCFSNLRDVKYVLSLLVEDGLLEWNVCPAFPWDDSHHHQGESATVSVMLQKQYFVRHDNLRLHV